MSHEIAETLDCLFLYFLFNNFFYSLFREKYVVVSFQLGPLTIAHHQGDGSLQNDAR